MQYIHSACFCFFPQENLPEPEETKVKSKEVVNEPLDQKKEPPEESSEVSSEELKNILAIDFGTIQTTVILVYQACIKFELENVFNLAKNSVTSQGKRDDIRFAFSRLYE